MTLQNCLWWPKVWCKSAENGSEAVFSLVFTNALLLFAFDRGCKSIVNSAASMRQKRLEVTVDVGWFQKCSVSGCSKAEPKGFTFTNGSCVPIVLCAPLASTDLVVERKWRSPQAERKSRVTMCETVDASLGFCGVLVSLCQKIWKEGKYRKYLQTLTIKVQALYNKHWMHLCVCLCSSSHNKYRIVDLLLRYKRTMRLIPNPF